MTYVFQNFPVLFPISYVLLFIYLFFYKTVASNDNSLQSVGKQNVANKTITNEYKTKKFNTKKEGTISRVLNLSCTNVSGFKQSFY